MTTLIGSDLLKDSKPQVLKDKLQVLGDLVDGTRDPKDYGLATAKAVKRYLNLSSDRTTDAQRRKDRQVEFLKILGAI